MRYPCSSRGYMPASICSEGSTSTLCTSPVLSSIIEPLKYPRWRPWMLRMGCPLGDVHDRCFCEVSRRKVKRARKPRRPINQRKPRERMSAYCSPNLLIKIITDFVSLVKDTRVMYVRMARLPSPIRYPGIINKYFFIYFPP